MKTKDLIERLNKEDPTGEAEVVVGTRDIFFAEALPMYYDGTPIILIRDKSKAPYYDVKGFKVGSSGTKVKLHLMGMDDVIENDPDCIVEYLDARSENMLADKVFELRVEEKKYREESKQIKKDLEQKIHNEDEAAHKFNIGLDVESQENIEKDNE